MLGINSYKIIEEGFYDIPWIQDITKDSTRFCEYEDGKLFIYFNSEMDAYRAKDRCYLRHILTKSPLEFDRVTNAFKITIICEPCDTVDLLDLKPKGDLSSQKPILD